MTTWLDTAEAAAATRKHPVTIRRALEGGELHGSQRTVRGRWLIREDCLDAWVEDRACGHQQTTLAAAVPLRRRA